MEQELLRAKLADINEAESIAISFVKEYEHTLIKDKMANIFEPSYELNKLEKTLEEIESDIRLCRGTIRKISAYYRKRREDICTVASTNLPLA